MGYTTTFEGQFTFDKPLTPEHKEYLARFSHTRHMKWNVEQIAALSDPVREAAGLPLGPEGAFFTGIEDIPLSAYNWKTNSYHPALIGYSDHPDAVPGLWCDWEPNTDGTAIQWSGAEKFYDYVEWLGFLITNFTAPWGYVLNGSVTWEGEDPTDTGTIIVTNNCVESIENEAEESDDEEDEE